MVMASSASPRMRECGMASAEAPTAGADLIWELDTLKDRRCRNAEAGKNGGVDKRLVALEFPGSAGGFIDAHDAPLRIDDPNRHATMREIKFDLDLETSGGFGGN